MYHRNAYLFWTKTLLKIELRDFITITISTNYHQSLFPSYKKIQKTVKRFRFISILKMKQSDWSRAFRPFCPKFGKMRVFSDIWMVYHTSPNHDVQQFSLFPAKSNDSILRGLFWAISGPFDPNSGQQEFLVFWTIN